MCGATGIEGAQGRVLAAECWQLCAGQAAYHPRPRSWHQDYQHRALQSHPPYILIRLGVSSHA